MARQPLEFGPPESTHTEGIRFKLYGPGWEEWFITVPEAPSGVLHELNQGIRYDAQRRAVYSAPNLVRFVLGVLREQAAKWLTDDAVPEGAEPITPGQAAERGLEVEGDDKAAGAKLYVVTTDDVARFFDLVHDKARPVPVEQLGQCVKELSEAMANRPTPPSRP